MLKPILNFLLFILIFIGLFLLWHNRWWFYDEYKLYGYNPPKAISTIATEDQLTNYGRTLLYIYHPDLEDSATFNNNCKVTTVAIVLGCTVIGRGIYLYNIQDPALNGVEQVTAAYEMLHVAYSRLSGDQLKTVNQLVMSTYNKLSVSDPLLKSEYESYLKTEGPGAVDNEMHSTLGTEVANLPPALAVYYQRYFKNRQVIVNYATQYESVFTTREAEVANDDANLATLKSQISALNTILSNEYVNIKDQQATMDSFKAEGNYSEYNANVASYNNSVNLYNSQIVTDQNLVDQYNALVAQRNSIAISENKLSNEINSLSATAPAN
jgi:hypothetical protein